MILRFFFLFLFILGAAMVAPSSTWAANDCVWLPSGDMACGVFKKPQETKRVVKPSSRASEASNYITRKPIILPKALYARNDEPVLLGLVPRTQTLFSAYLFIDTLPQCAREIAQSVLSDKISMISKAHNNDAAAQIKAIDALNLLPDGRWFLGRDLKC